MGIYPILPDFADMYYSPVFETKITNIKIACMIFVKCIPNLLHLTDICHSLIKSDDFITVYRIDYL